MTNNVLHTTQERVIYTLKVISEFQMTPQLTSYLSQLQKPELCEIGRIQFQFKQIKKLK